MIIQQLDMVGFKSFANRTVIGFAPGICAIVGPNGCGKSNVLDALRWVMGEQSARQLRGKAMEDVIFSGTGDQSPLSMAEVSLLLSAPAEAVHSVPAIPGMDSTDVQITRRLHRSGESEYLLNRQPCRLKDIQQLLMGHGATGKSYTVIQQGNIGAITEATPEERRQYLDEASGAVRYKSKRSDTAKKLEETAEHLRRLEDILAEIKRQMAVLQRQAKRAKAYLDLQHTVHRLELLYGLKRLAQEEAILQDLAEQKRSLLHHERTHRQMFEENRAALDSLRVRLEKVKTGIREMTGRLQQVERRIERASQETEYVMGEATRLEHEHVECLQGLQRIAERTVRQQEERQNLAERQDVLVRELQTAEEQLRESRRIEAECRSRMEPLKRQMEQAQTSILRLSADEAKTLQAGQTAAENRRKTEHHLRRVAEELAAARKNESVIAGQKREILEEVEELDRRIVHMEAEIDRRRRELGETTAVFRQRSERIRLLQDKRRGLEVRYATLRKLVSAYEGFSGAVKAVVRDWPKHLEAADGQAAVSPMVIADVIHVDCGYEMAVELVLNDVLQWVMLPSVDQVRSAIHFLSGKPSGRCGFVLPARKQEAHRAPLAGGFSGEPLIDHVRFSADVPMLHALLENVFVVDTAEQALAAYGSLSFGQRMVSRDGVLVCAEGAIFTGYGSDVTGLLSRKAELEAIESERNACALELAEAEKAAKQAELDVKSGEKVLSRLLTEIQECREDRQDADKRRIQLEERWTHVRRNLDILTIEQERLSGEESDSEVEVDRLQETLDEVRSALRREQERLQTGAIERERLEKDLETAERQRQSAQLAMTSVQANLENVRDSVRRLHQALAEGERQSTQLQERLQTIIGRQSECADKIELNRRSIDQWRREMEELRRQVDASEAEAAGLEAERVHLEETIRDLQNSRDTTAKRLQWIEIETAEHRGLRDHAVSDIGRITSRSIDELRHEMAETIGDPGFDVEAVLEEIRNKREQLQRFGEINTAAIRELAEIRQRHDFLESQKADLLKAMDDLQTAIRKIDQATRQSFLEIFHAVNAKLGEVFPQLFDGGTAGLVMTDPDNPLESGVEFMIQPPGKRLTRLSLLSGGEKALCAIAFIFSIFLIRPASFCLLDEIDAPLDEANVLRFNRLLNIVGERAQIVIATHNRRTMAFADMLIGVTMETKGISRIVPVKWEDVHHFVKEAN